MVEREIQGMRLRVRCADGFRAQGEGVLDLFQRLYEGKGALGAGAQIRFGWSLLRVVEEGDGLYIAEPDFEQWPVEAWVAKIDTTIEVVTEQVRLLKRFGVKGEDACFDQMLFAARGALQADEVFLRRTASRSATDSGWLLAALADPEALGREDGLEAVLIARLAKKHHGLMSVLSLPTDFIATFRGGELQQVLDPQGRSLFGTGTAPRIS